MGQKEFWFWGTQPLRAPEQCQQHNSNLLTLLPTRNWAEGSCSSSEHITQQQWQITHGKSASSRGSLWFMLDYADSGQEKALSLFKDILSFTFRRRKWAYHFHRKRKGLTLLWEGAGSHTPFNPSKDLAIMFSKAVIGKRKSKLLIKYGDSLGICLWKSMIKNLQLRSSLYSPLCSASSFLKCMGHRASVTPWAWLLRVWEVSLVWGSFSFTSNLNVPFLEGIPLSFIL